MKMEGQELKRRIYFYKYIFIYMGHSHILYF